MSHRPITELLNELGHDPKLRKEFHADPVAVANSKGVHDASIITAIKGGHLTAELKFALAHEREGDGKGNGGMPEAAAPDPDFNRASLALIAGEGEEA